MLAGGKGFTKLDLSYAYNQLLIDIDESQEHVVINTHKSLYRYTCTWGVQFGIAHVPAKFLKVILQGFPGVVLH